MAIFANSGIYLFFDADAANPAPAQPHFDAIQAYIRPDNLEPRRRVAGQGAVEQLIPDGCRLCVPIEVKEQSLLKQDSWLVVGAVPDLPFIFDDVSMFPGRPLFGGDVRVYPLLLRTL